MPAYNTVTIPSFGHEVTGGPIASAIPVSATWPTNNRAIFVPFAIEAAFNAVKMRVLNGATASGNIDVGIYTWDGTRLVSGGGVAQSATSALQEFDITDKFLAPGRYYMALALSSTVGTVFRKNTTLSILNAIGLKQMASAYPLPATVTFASFATAYWPMFDITSIP